MSSSNRLLSAYFYNLYMWIAHFFMKIGFYLGRVRRETTNTKTITYLDNDMKYIHPLKTRFLRDISGGAGAAGAADLHNQNIVSVFYNKKEFGETVATANNVLETEWRTRILMESTETVATANNVLETEWRTRILMESTPRGNIIMYFDAYKLGFAYYCDQNVISYDILNAMAMKYVSVYKCRDFFMDETFVCSPLIKIHLLEEPKKPFDLSGGKVVIGGGASHSQKSPFAKLRNYAKESKDTKDTEKNTDQRERVSYSEFKKMIKKQE